MMKEIFENLFKKPVKAMFYFGFNLVTIFLLLALCTVLSPLFILLATFDGSGFLKEFNNGFWWEMF